MGVGFKDINLGDVVEFVYENKKGEIKDRKVKVANVYPLPKDNGYELILEGEDENAVGDIKTRKFHESGVVAGSYIKITRSQDDFNKQFAAALNNMPRNLQIVSTKKKSIEWMPRADGTRFKD